MTANIRRRGRSFQVRIFLGKDPITGKLRYAARSAKSQVQAKAIRDEIRAQKHVGPYTPPSTITLGGFLTEWLEKGVRGHRETSTTRGYENIVRQAQAAPLGMISLRDLSPQHLDAYYAQKKREGLSGTTIGGHHRVLSSALTRARKWGYINRNPAQDATPPTSDTEETPSLDEEQVDLLLGRARRESPYYALYYTAALTGMRSSELAGLPRTNLDLRDLAIYVRQAFLRVGKQEVWKKPKSKAGRRRIAITEHLADVLREVLTEQDRAKEILGRDYHDHGLVFCQGNGKPLWMRSVLQRDFYPLLERCGLPRVTMHSLRHSSISMAARAGIDASVIQRRAGHSSIQTTMGIYRHVQDAEDHDAARRMEERFLGHLERDKQSYGQKYGQSAKIKIRTVRKSL
jgi:integrase